MILDLPERMSNFGHHIMSGMKKKWLTEINGGHIMAIALHPNFKSLSILNSCDMLKSLVKPNIEDLITSISLSMGQTDQREEVKSAQQFVQSSAQIDFMDPIETETLESNIE